jgi:hypothetical protein
MFSTQKFVDTLFIVAVDILCGMIHDVMTHLVPTCLPRLVLLVKAQLINEHLLRGRKTYKPDYRSHQWHHSFHLITT